MIQQSDSSLDRGLDPASSLPVIYRELRRLAARYLRAERAGHTLDPTALVHEAWMRLATNMTPTMRTHADLIGIAARLMRQVLVNHAVRRNTLRRGGDRRRVPLEHALALFEARCHDLVALDDALDQLATVDARQAQVVELRFFGGLTIPEIARHLDSSVRTIERDWTNARTWLHAELHCESS